MGATHCLEPFLRRLDGSVPHSCVRPVLLLRLIPWRWLIQRARKTKTMVAP